MRRESGGDPKPQVYSLIPVTSGPIQEAITAGFDLTMVDESLALSHEERAKRHDQALALVLEFDQIQNERDAGTHQRLERLADSGVEFMVVS